MGSKLFNISFFSHKNIHLILLRKFDIGIYVIMTSVNPLRVYTFNSDVLLRFCAKKYLPFNSTDLDSYVVGDDYTPIWEVCIFHTIQFVENYFFDNNF